MNRARCRLDCLGWFNDLCESSKSMGGVQGGGVLKRGFGGGKGRVLGGRAVVSHPSQKARRMGHPSFPCGPGAVNISTTEHPHRDLSTTLPRFPVETSGVDHLHAVSFTGNRTRGAGRCREVGNYWGASEAGGYSDLAITPRSVRPLMKNWTARATSNRPMMRTRMRMPDSPIQPRTRFAPLRIM